MIDIITISKILFIVLIVISILFFITILLLAAYTYRILTVLYETDCSSKSFDKFIRCIISYISSFMSEEDVKKILHNSIKMLCNEYNAYLPDEDLNRSVNGIYEEIVHDSSNLRE